MFKWTLPLAAVAGVTVLSIGTLNAQQAAPRPIPGTMDVTRAEAGTYAADPRHTLIGWRVNHLGFNDYFGIFGNVTGTLEIDPAAPQSAKVDITIPVAEVVTANAALTAHLTRAGRDGASPDFFGAEAAPARFVSTSVMPNGTRAMIHGDLTVRGVTKPIVIDAQFTGAGTTTGQTPRLTLGFEGTTTIKRSDWGITFGTPAIGDEVELDISVGFEKQ